MPVMTVEVFQLAAVAGRHVRTAACSNRAETIDAEADFILTSSSNEETLS